MKPRQITLYPNLSNLQWPTNLRTHQPQPDEPSADGFDITASTNVLSHFLLCRELMDDLERAAAGERGEARVVHMSSGSGFGPPAFDERFYERKGGNLGGPQKAYERYHQSKLANLLCVKDQRHPPTPPARLTKFDMVTHRDHPPPPTPPRLRFTQALHEKLVARGSSVKALACTPGVCGTDMFVQVASAGGRKADLSRVPSPEDGCLAQLKCIADPSLSSGELWGPPGMGGPPVQVRMAPPTVLVDAQAKEDLWAVCERATGPFDL